MYIYYIYIYIYIITIYVYAHINITEYVTCDESYYIKLRLIYLWFLEKYIHLGIYNWSVFIIDFI